MDQMIIATAWNKQIRVIVAVTTELVIEAQKRHDLWPTASAVLGRALTGGLLMASNLKESQKLTLRFLGDGPCGAVLVDANSSSMVRGYLQEPHVQLPPTSQGKLDVAGAVGKGMFVVSKDLGFGDPYSGQVPIQTGEIASDIAYYYAVSEQIPTAMGLGVLVKPDHSIQSAGGYLVQLMPGTSEEESAELEHRLHHLPSPTEMISEHPSADHLLYHLFNEDEVEILETRDVSFQCSCNRERLENIFGSMSSDDLSEMIQQDEPIETICHFCRERYVFLPEEIQRILNQKTPLK